jgi:hypothetical protein
MTKRGPGGLPGRIEAREHAMGQFQQILAAVDQNERRLTEGKGPLPTATGSFVECPLKPFALASILVAFERHEGGRAG